MYVYYTVITATGDPLLSHRGNLMNVAVYYTFVVLPVARVETRMCMYVYYTFACNSHAHQGRGGGKVSSPGIVICLALSLRFINAKQKWIKSNSGPEVS